MTRQSRLAVSITIALLLSQTFGCVYSLQKRISPGELKLRIVTSHAGQYVIRVALAEPMDYPVASDGTVAFTVPPFRNGCDIYFLGTFKTRDGSPEKVPLIHIRQDTHIVRRLSISQFSNLPVDAAGYHVLQLED